MPEIFIPINEDGSQWLPLPNPNARTAGCKQGHERIGILLIDGATLRSGFPVAAILSQVTIVHCEHLYFRDAFEYVAYSEYFEECPSGIEPPFYEVQCHTKNGRFSSFEFLRINNVNKFTAPISVSWTNEE